MAQGVCKLTGKHGAFIEAHLIPKALTKPERPGLPFLQAGDGNRPTRRWTSWYDNQLVTQSGEDILTALDTWAITELRRNKLVWSGWQDAISLGGNHEPIPETEYGFRTIVGVDTRRLRLFLLSLLWRAAATSRPEFNAIDVPVHDLEQIRQMVLTGSVEPIEFYAMQLIQLSTLGSIHNLTPWPDTKTLKGEDDGKDEIVPFFCFYFDGLIVHVHRKPERKIDPTEPSRMFVGESDKLVFLTITYEASRQRENLQYVISEAEKNWPESLNRF